MPRNPCLRTIVLLVLSSFLGGIGPAHSPMPLATENPSQFQKKRAPQTQRTPFPQVLLEAHSFTTYPSHATNYQLCPHIAVTDGERRKRQYTLKNHNSSHREKGKGSSGWNCPSTVRSVLGLTPLKAPELLPPSHPGIPGVRYSIPKGHQGVPGLLILWSSPNTALQVTTCSKSR